MSPVAARLVRLTAVALCAAAGAPAAAGAAAPSVSTSSASSVSSTSATLRGSVNPGGEATTAYFEYGRTTRYGSRTADLPVGDGTARRSVSVRVTGLQPNATYHFRLVASNPSGVASGGDRSFRTPAQPLGLSLSANPTSLTFGQTAVLSGRLTGSPGRRAVILQQRTFPFTGRWADIAGPVTTGSDGRYRFAARAVYGTTEFRTRLSTSPEVVSDVAAVVTAARVGLRVSSYSVRRGGSILFTGSVRPRRDGAQYAIQKETTRGRWVVVAGGRLGSGSPNYSRYSKRVKVPRGGRYRVYVGLPREDIISGLSRVVTIRTR